MEDKAMTIFNENIMLTIHKFSSQGMVRNIKKINFQLHFLSDVPILTFHFGNLGDAVFYPIYFASLGSWPEAAQLCVIIELIDAENHATAVRQLLLSKDDTEVIQQARYEQLKMTNRQVESIIDLITPEFLGLTEQPLLAQ
jgi:hypothetical protein